MSVKLNNNPTCVLTDANIYSDSQKAKMAKNLMTGIPATSGEGDKVLVLDENGDPQLKDYSSGGSSYTAGSGIDITNDEISVKVDGGTITVNPFNGSLEAAQSGKVALISTESSSIYAEVSNAILNLQIPVLVADGQEYGTLYKVEEASPGHYEYRFWFMGYITGSQIAGGIATVNEANGYYRVWVTGDFIPGYSSSDEGKVLKIVEGSAIWSNP